MKSVVPWKRWDYNHTQHSAKVIKLPQLCLTFSLQNYTFLQHGFKFGTFLLLFFFLEYLCILRKGKKIQTKKVKWWQLCILCHNPVWVSSFTHKKPLSWQLFSAIRYAVLENPSLGGRRVGGGRSGCYFTRVVSTTCTTTDKIPPR